MSFEKCRIGGKAPKCKGRVEFRDDIVKDDSGSYAVFTEQGSSASQLTAAKVMDIIAVSAYTQVKMEDAPKLLKIPKSECPGIWIRLPRHKWPKSWSSMEDPVVLLERNLYGHPLAGLLSERQFEKVLLKYVWGAVPNWECSFVNREKGWFLSVHVDDIKLTGKKQNINPTLENSHERRWFGEKQHHFLTHVYLGCTQRECKISNDIVANYREMFESRISAGAKWKLSTGASGKPDAETVSSWSYDKEGHTKKCMERFSEFANKTTQQLFKVATPCMDDH